MRKLVLLLLVVTYILAFMHGYKIGRPPSFNFNTELSDINETLGNLDAEWLLNPIRYKFINYFLMLPAKSTNDGSLALFAKNGYPLFITRDLNGDGNPNEFVIVDRYGRSVAVLTHEDDYSVFHQVFKTVSGTPKIDGVTYIDENFDGFPDIRYSDIDGAERIR